MSDMLHILRVYEPRECDAVTGVPLDWGRCCVCNGDGRLSTDAEGMSTGSTEPCYTCGGHGSLKAAALHNWRHTLPASALPTRIDEAVTVTFDPPFMLPRDVRCEDCGHPQGEGTWELRLPVDVGEEDMPEVLRRATFDLHAGIEPVFMTHHSACDDDCRHAGPMRWATFEDDTGWFTHERGEETPGWPAGSAVTTLLQAVRPYEGGRVEASWRPVDIRCLGWPHDLRPERLAILCLRCFAARAANTEVGDP